MIETRSGLKIKFTKLDEWAVKMTVSIPHITGDKIVASPIITIDQLKEELARLELAPTCSEDQ